MIRVALTRAWRSEALTGYTIQEGNQLGTFPFKRLLRLGGITVFTGVLN